MSNITVDVTQSEVLATLTAANVSANVSSADISAAITTADVTANVEAANVTVNITGGGSPHIIQDEGDAVTQRANLNFVGPGVSVTDDSANNATVVTIPGGGGSSGVTVEAGEDIPAGSLVYIAGDGLAYLADANDESKEATLAVLDEILQGNEGTANVPGYVISGLTGLTTNIRYFLSDITPGAFDSVMPDSGIIQQVGHALTDTNFLFSPRVSALIDGSTAFGEFRITEDGIFRTTESGLLRATETGFRATENGNIRITEGGAYRITE